MQKLITYNRANKDFDMFLDGAYVGSRERHHEAEVELDRLAYEAPSHSAGPVEAAVAGALERLADEHSAAARLADELGDKAHRKAERAATTAFVNALIEYKAGVRPDLLASGAWLLPSRRTGEAPHIVRMDGDWTCSCVAGANMHWPIALVIGCEVAGDDMQRFDDGEDGPIIHLELERAPVVLTPEALLDQADALMDRMGHLKAEARGFTPTSARLERVYQQAERRYYRRLDATRDEPPVERSAFAVAALAWEDARQLGQRLCAARSRVMDAAA